LRMLKPLPSAIEGARVLKIGDRTLRQITSRGEIKAIRAKEGGKLYIPRSEILRILGEENPARQGGGK